MIGLTRQPTMPVSAKPVISSPAADGPPDPDGPDHQHGQRPTRTHSSVLGSAACSRATAPLSDWLEMNASAPTRSVFHSASVQKTRDASGATAAASSVAAAAVALATSAARHRLVTSR